MAAPTNTYCSWATGNDYKGATFTDGAYTSATKVLVKAGAFTANLAGHWLYLESNDGGSIVAGHYKIATRTSADEVILATDAGAGVDDDAAKCTQAAGTTLLPWRSVQGALDLITRDATNGDQVNIKAGVGQVQVNNAALALTTYGTPTTTVPLILRGYTTDANDGGMAEIDCGGATMLAAAGAGVHLVDMEVHTFGDNIGINTPTAVHHCEVHKGASTPSGKTLVYRVTTIMLSYIHDAGATGIGVGGVVLACNNFVADCPTGISATYGSNPMVSGNVVRDCAIGITTNQANASVIGNTVYISSASTGAGISIATAPCTVMNNIVEGYSGAGGDGILSTIDLLLLGYNAFYNNTNPETLVDVYCDLGNDVTLAASPFTSPANGDFSLTAAAKAALRGVGWPAAYLGAHANTDGHVTIGAIQYGEDETAAAVYPAAANVLEAETAFGPTGADYAGTYHEAEAGEVESGVTFGPASAYTGTLAAGGSGIWGTFGRW